MKLGDAVKVLNNQWVCACAGTPSWDPTGPCYCQRVVDEARTLQRGAHIAVKLMADTAGTSGRMTPEGR